MADRRILMTEHVIYSQMLDSMTAGIVLGDKISIVKSDLIALAQMAPLALQ